MDKINYNIGNSFASLLTIVFITLKLTGIAPVAMWSWWWILSPLWISFAISFVLIISIVLIAIAVSK
jgi:hypothetical protein